MKRIRNFLRHLIIHYLPTFLLKRLTPCRYIAFDLTLPESLSWRERLQIRFHLLFCHSCWIYNEQNKIVSINFKKALAEETYLSQDHLQKLDEINQKIISKCSCGSKK